MGGQLRLKLEHSVDFSRDRFIVSPANREAAETLDTWPDRQKGALALIGPPGSGKTHLATVWAERTNATVLNAALDAEAIDQLSGPVLLDGADEAPHGEAFFHLLNKTERSNFCALLTGCTAPNCWPVEVQDLRSRLNALPVIQLGEPDDVILKGVLVKLFQARNIRPPQDLLAYLLLRMERSAPAAQTLVAALDEASSAENRPVSRALAREILKDDAEDALREV